MSVYKDMAHDAGYRGEEAEQMAQAIEQDHMRQSMEHQEQEPDQVDMMAEDELRAYVRQLVEAVTNLSYIIRCVSEATGRATSCAELLEARQLAGLAPASERQ